MDRHMEIKDHTSVVSYIRPVHIGKRSDRDKPGWHQTPDEIAKNSVQYPDTSLSPHPTSDCPTPCQSNQITDPVSIQMVGVLDRLRMLTKSWARLFNDSRGALFTNFMWK